MPAHYWMDLSWRDFEARDMAETIAILPTAAIEQHGPHLPVGVDTMIAQGYLDRVAALMPADLPALILPIQSIGKSNEHLAYPGTLTFSASSILSAWVEIGESVARAGCRKLVIVNAHGGNVALIDIIARELRVRFDMLAVTTAWHRLGYPPGLFSAREATHGIHGGDAETSLMLAFRPETVRMEHAADFVSRGEGLANQFTHLRIGQPAGFGWMSQDLHPEGVVGEAHLATAEKGNAAADFGARAFIELLRDVQRFNLADLKEGPLG